MTSSGREFFVQGVGYFKEINDPGTFDSLISDQSPDKPASGKLMLRVPPEVHRAALVAAEASGVSLNQWAAKVLNEAAHHG